MNSMQIARAFQADVIDFIGDRSMTAREIATFMRKEMGKVDSALDSLHKRGELSKTAQTKPGTVGRREIRWSVPPAPIDSRVARRDHLVAALFGPA